MAPDAEPYRTLIQLEESLWRAETRGDRKLMDQTFAEDCYEFGRSGRVWNRDELLFDGAADIDVALPLPNLKITLLNDVAALVTYDSVVRRGTVGYAHRSSVWSMQGGRWRLRFHQGTPFEPDMHAFSDSAADASKGLPCR